MNMKLRPLALTVAFFAASFVAPTGLLNADEPSARKPGDVKVVKIAGVDVAFRWCPPGEFTMGSPETEKGRDTDEQVHRVTISRGYWLAETETTQALWLAVMGANPSAQRGENYPVERVSWNDCQAFVAKIEQFAPNGMKFRLPSEAHWEYACRAGTQTAYSWGDEWSHDKANSFKGVTLNETKPVGSYPANAWGFKDMHGNVWEWCEDVYGAYSTEPATDPGGASTGDWRVFRGGSWHDLPRNCRAADRRWYAPDNKYIHLGFRLELSDASR